MIKYNANVIKDYITVHRALKINNTIDKWNQGCKDDKIIKS